MSRGMAMEGMLAMRALEVRRPMAVGKAIMEHLATDRQATLLIKKASDYQDFNISNACIMEELAFAKISSVLGMLLHF